MPHYGDRRGAHPKTEQEVGGILSQTRQPRCEPIPQKVSELTRHHRRRCWPTRRPAEVEIPKLLEFMRRARRSRRTTRHSICPFSTRANANRPGIEIHMPVIDTLEFSREPDVPEPQEPQAGRGLQIAGHQPHKRAQGRARRARDGADAHDRMLDTAREKGVTRLNELNTCVDGRRDRRGVSHHSAGGRSRRA